MTGRVDLSSGERVLWRVLIQAAHEAADKPEVETRRVALKKASTAAKEVRMPDMRPLPAACFRAFVVMARGLAEEGDVAVRAQLGHRLAALAEAAGDILDGLACDTRPQHPPSWTERADLA